MATATVTGTDESTRTRFARRRYIVQTRAAWTGDGDDAEWTEAKYAEPLSFDHAAAPTMPTARLQFRFGSIVREGAVAFATETALAVRGRFVRIVQLGEAVDADTGEPKTTQTAVWRGIIAAEDTMILPVDDGDPAAGDLTMTAYGLQHMLDGVVPKGAFAHNGQAGGDSQVVQLHDMPAINQLPGFGQTVAGNRSSATYNTTANPDTGDPDTNAPTYVYSGFDRDAWTARQFIDYLLANHGPGTVTFKLAGQTDALDQMTVPVEQINGMSVYQIINRLIDRRRGIGWTLRFDKDENPTLHVSTMFESDVSAGDVTVPKNTEQVTIDLDGMPQLMQSHVRFDDLSRYDSIFVRGARIKSTFTVGIADGSLVTGWSSADETAYKAGAYDPTDPASIDDAEANDIARGSEANKWVYRLFGLPYDWDYTVDGFGQDASFGTNYVFPLMNDAGVVSPGLPGVADYTFTRLLPQLTITKTMESVLGSNDDPLVPFAIVQHPTGDGTEYLFVHKLADAGFNSMGLKMEDKALAFTLTGSFGHNMALNHWTGAATSQTEPTVDYSTLYATICAEGVDRLRYRVALTDTSPPARELVIDVPGAELHTIAAQTVLDVQAGQLVVQDSATETRNDVDRLKAVAAFARGWYGRARASIELTCEDTACWPFEIGALVKQVQLNAATRDVWSPITKIDVDVQNGRSVLRTNFGELDFRAAAGGDL